jgi:ribose/xylose/arabinose/galactoside ABC-type transport system permease subunit
MSEGRPASAGAGARAWAGTRQFRPVLCLLVALVVVLVATQPSFRTSSNLQNLLSGVSVLWVVSIGMTFALLSAGADLSVGAVATLAGVGLGELVSHGVPGFAAIVIVVLVGALLGALANGLFVGFGRLSFFVVTLASMTALTGAVNLWTNGRSTYVTDGAVTGIGDYKFAGLTIPVWIMIGTFAVGLWVQRATYFGRDVYAVGGSVTAANLSGIRTGRTLTAVYALTAGCAALAGVVAVGRIGVAVPNVDGNLPLQSIAAVLLGGTSLMGGLGGLGGTALGVLFIGTLQNGLSLAGLPSFWQQVVTGVILVLAVSGDRLAHRGSSWAGPLGRRLGRRPAAGRPDTVPTDGGDPAADPGGKTAGNVTPAADRPAEPSGHPSTERARR